MMNFRKAFVVTLLVITAVWIASTIFVELYDYARLPAAPDEQTGRTSKLVVNHGFIRYGSIREARTLEVTREAFPFAAFPFFFAFLLSLYWGVLPIRGHKKT